MKLLVDSSVIVSAVRPDQIFHMPTLEFFERVRSRGDEVWVPMTMFWEIGAALDHPNKTPSGITFNKLFYLELKFIPIDEELFKRTWKSNLRVPVKGADRIFVSCAIDQQATLISWDDNLIKYAAVFGIEAKKPSEYQ